MPREAVLAFGKDFTPDADVGVLTTTPSNGAGVNGLAFALWLMQRECRRWGDRTRWLRRPAAAARPSPG